MWYKRRVLAPAEVIMAMYSFSHLSDPALLCALDAAVARERARTADVVALLAELLGRRLYRAEGYPSLFEYCVRKLGLSEDCAFKRIRAAKAARWFPQVLPALADGRLHLSAIVVLAPVLTAKNGAELLTLAIGRSRRDVEKLVAERFPRSEMLGLVETLPAQVAPGPLLPVAVKRDGPGEPRVAPGQLVAATPLPSHATGARVAPIAQDRLHVELTMSRSTNEKLEYARTLLSHQVPPGDLAGVLEKVLDIAIEQLEKKKFAATGRPRVRLAQPETGQRGDRLPRRPSRYIPAEVRRAVWKRDQGRCTFQGASGHRCQSSELLEFDHATPLAWGGLPTVSGLRLRCRAHNQYEAERAFGASFMEGKRRSPRSEQLTDPATGDVSRAGGPGAT